MTDQQQSIKIPLDLLQQMVDDLAPLGMEALAAAIVQWGWEQRGAAIEVELQQARDEELNACCEWLDFYSSATDARDLRLARRPPTPPSLKEQALAELEKVDMLWDTSEFGADTLSALDTIRRALEQLND